MTTDLTVLDPDFWLMIVAIFFVSLAFGAILYKLTNSD